MHFSCGANESGNGLSFVEAAAAGLVGTGHPKRVHHGVMGFRSLVLMATEGQKEATEAQKIE